MGNTLVLFKSKYGSARQYAEWIAAELEADLYELSSLPAAGWTEYSTIIFCGGVYASKINGIRKIIRRQDLLAGKNVIVAACALSDPDNEDNHTIIINSSFSGAQHLLQKNVKFFLLKGGIDHAKLNFFDNMIMRFMEKSLRHRDPETLTQGEKNLKSILANNFDFKERALIQPLVDYCRSL
jgi:menaquinone-dependent protoporphyrinogen IX oxidase